MADTLEHREGISHVAFNFLVSEVCQALEQGLEAEHSEITRHWGQAYSKSNISKMFRGLSNASLFQRGWHSWRDENSGHYRRRRTFNLDRNHPAVVGVLKDRGVPGTNGNSASSSDGSSDETAAAVTGVVEETDGTLENSGTVPTGPGRAWESEFSEDAHSYTGAHAESANRLEGQEDADDPEVNSAVSFFSRLFRAKNEAGTKEEG